ncbi:2-amino-4-hydroxy-6-hydroxymethyldihydropteridine diphosphokinase [Sediminicurvatus halobius]|uniref:2-amino-4-hydroxy-6-hydroxymethyldihydropteridine pyrophosphokinase n=1 Tax=Sediminicurvatus halobius TaxID=2182432 RepID=A0A2U2N189_9GAMM|nr:2-amino-4-hydroxy-6-hydroxymethyldihydropteridine diphosphokinase [Spiribacter halobius]PWG62813.1 2-amino-4-hydroxy-6-hydroxymethyldihydropteridine diphosphokinase [Spiribacter halobius]UEX77037.1 2-amino-4-hydroxy-6-hydroxymethyldihydropteridine diphosphokinase [Spiribacter halobius]
MSAATVRAFVGIGSNLDDPPAQVTRALEALADLPGTRRVAASRRYRNPPMGPPGQPHYVNAVAELATTLGPEPLLDALQAIEARAGRRRAGARWGPRPLDLDLLLYGDRQLRTERLTVPHPGIATRAFVLYPLADIDPDLHLPGIGPLRERLAAVPADGLEPLAEGQ